MKLWPCGCERGNPWHWDCEDPRCHAEKGKERGLGVSCLYIGVPSERRRARGNR